MIYEHFKADMPFFLFLVFAFFVAVVIVILICPRGVILKIYMIGSKMKTK